MGKDHRIWPEYSMEDRDEQVGWSCEADNKGWTLDDKKSADQHAKENG